MSRFQEEFRARLLTPEDLVQQLRPGDFVILGTWLGQPP